ncbi:sensor domain-containing diguanylate cyclase [Amantichitinum ursilacus]|uniref:Response regulator PleD n=1 Tax=Amantichitinum ursilacus TaxID=857265 RepID=A0A0N0GKT9_9NEIS|nr:diguanylate cyclase [Amantichitinum ursilacus]KPC49164.1 Response regulator PleD [Amantichitinum ursilacus]
MLDMLREWLNTPGFMPHGHCFLWTPTLLWMMVAADGVIAVSYFAIAFGLWYYIRRRHDFGYKALAAMFGAFICACGITHALSIWDIWNFSYWLEGYAKLITALISAATAVMLWPMIPRLLALPSRDELAETNAELQRQIALTKATAETLEISERRYRQLVETAVEGIWTLDNEGYTTFVNRTMAEMLGTTEEAMLGRHLFDFMDASEQTLAQRNMARRLSGVVERHDFRFRRTDNTPLYAIVSSGPIHDEHGEVVGMLGVITDITDRERIANELAELTAGLEYRVQERTAELAHANRELENSIAEQQQTAMALQEQETWLRAILDSTVDGIITLNSQGEILSANPAATHIFGYPGVEMLGRSIHTLMPDLFKEDVDDHRPGAVFPIDHGKVVNGVRHDGAQIPVEIAISELRLSGDRQFVGMLRDITERQENEESIRLLNRELIKVNSNLELQVTERQSAEGQLQVVNTQLQTLVGSLKRQTEEIGLLNEMSELLQSCMELTEAMGVLATFSGRFIGADAGCLYLAERNGGLLQRIGSWGGRDEESEVALRHEDCWAMRQGRLHPLADLQANLICKHLHLEEQRYSLCIPLYAQGQNVGLLNLRRSEPFIDGDGNLARAQQIMLSFSEQVALALANINLRQRLQNLSLRDPLTGLFNRRYLDEQFELELARARRGGGRFAVLMMDLDHFKRFNDNFGHDAGDYLLQNVARTLLATVREGDVVSRWGGEEFMILMPEIDQPIAEQRAEAIRSEMGLLRPVFQQQPLGKVSVSIGLSFYPQHGHTAQLLIAAADHALYAAKSGGRDRVVIATP